MTVNISIAVGRDNPETVAMIRGGIRIKVDGVRVAQYRNEEQMEWLYDWNPEYVGEHVRSDLLNFMDALRHIKEGDETLYEPIRVDLEGVGAYFTVERVSDTKLRIAFKLSSTQEIRKGYLPPARSARGFIVKADDAYQEIISSGYQFLEFAKQFGFDEDDPLLNQFQSILLDFKSVTGN